MFNLSEEILLTLARIVDLLGEVPTKRDWYHLNYLLKERSPRKSYYKALRRLMATGEIEKKVDDRGGVFFRVTPQGWQRLTKRFSLQSWRRKKWDGFWRQAIFDIEEKYRLEREEIRSKLKSLGFGMLQESVWISPFPIEKELAEYFNQRRWRGEVLVQKTETELGDDRKLAARAFKLGELNERYEDLADQWEELLSEEDDDEGERRKNVWEQSYFEVLAVDPLLPKELLPKPWFGYAVEETFRRKIKKPFWQRVFRLSKAR